jgi:DNA-binding NtrC family response regulator
LVSRKQLKWRDVCMDRVLLVDGDERFSHDMGVRLAGRGLKVSLFRTAEEGVKAVREGDAKYVFTESVLPDGDGFPLLAAAHTSRSYTPVVMVSKSFSPELVLSAIAKGAYDCIPKPVDDPTLDSLLERLEDEENALGGSHRPPGPRNKGEDGMVVGSCPEMIETLKTVGAVAETMATVLVRGESGTGKELLARAVHKASGRTGSFVAINCAAVVESLTETELFGHERGAFTGATDRREGCFEQANVFWTFL